MELADGTRDVVDPEVRAYVSSLVTALGGSGADEDGRYVLGDDAAAVLRDIKRWLKLYDEKANRLDVARCLAESNLVGGDLLQILASWPEYDTDSRLKAKIALSCLEILVPLTWPIDRPNSEMTVNHHRHIPYIQLAQIAYKRSIINYDGARILHTAVRVALPSIAEAQSERSSRDVGIIRLVLYFFRNIAMITPHPKIAYDGDEAEISRSATIDAFDYQEIFHLLLTVSSTMGEDFSLEDVVVMEVIFHLVKGVAIDKLFLDDEQWDKSKTSELIGLRSQEAGMQRYYKRTQPTRHNRFGTMVWVKREDAKMSTVSGQNALIDDATTLAKMDKSKKFKPPRKVRKAEEGSLDFDMLVALTARANKNLRAFVEDFLDSGFNPLFQHVRKAIDREAERVLDTHPRQFFYLVSWFLQAARVRRTSKGLTSKGSKGPVMEELDGFSLVASVLNQEMFITLARAMESTLEYKSWHDLSAVMRCFTQILLTVQEMSESPLDDDQEIAENILARLFYEETTHDRIANIIRYYKDQGFGYLDSCTELVYHYLRILENYSKQNPELVVRSKRRARRKTKEAKAVDDGISNVEDVNESDPEEEARAEAVSKERKFDFKRFAHRFLSQGCIDTYVAFCSFYNDLSTEQLKRAHRLFYRVAFKMEMSVMLFRIDIIALFHKMIRGPEGLDSKGPLFKEWDEMIRHVIKLCTRKIQERPELIVEMMFSKTNATAHFLKNGYEVQTIKSKARAAAELEVKPGMEWEEQVAVVVSALLDRNQGDHLDWVKSQLSSAEVERKSWEQANNAAQTIGIETATAEAENSASEPTLAPPIFLKPDNEDRKAALFKNGYLRLLMKLIGFNQLLSEEDDPDASWVIPSSLLTAHLAQAHNLIKATEFNPPVFEDGVLAEDHIRRKASTRPVKPREAFDDEDENGVSEENEEFFPAGGPTARKPSEAIAALKKSRRKRMAEGSEAEENDEEAEQRRREREKQRAAREREKQRKIKSTLYVNDTDDEVDPLRDDEFFEREERLRQKQNTTVLKELMRVARPVEENNGGKRKRSAVVLEDDSDEEVLAHRRSDGSSPETLDHPDDVLGDSEDGDEETPASSPHIRSSQTKRRRISSGSDRAEEEVDEGSIMSTAIVKDLAMADMAEVLDEEEDDIPIARPARRRVVSGFVMDSSDEE